MRIPGLKTARLSGRWLRSRFKKHALILGYHRVAASTSDSFKLCVSPKNFAEHLEILQSKARLLSLSALVEGIRAGQLPERAVALTFDDGYADVLHFARPLLERFEIPATVFVVTGSLGSQFWWDQLERILFTAASIPDPILLMIEGCSFEWRSLDERRKVDDQASARKALLRSLYERLLKVQPEECQRVLAELEARIGVDASSQEPAPGVLTAEEISQLAEGGLIEIGSHSVSHPLLASLPVSKQISEIHESKACLESILGKPVASFSFPNGSTSDKTSSLVRQAGFQCACTSFNDLTLLSSDLYRLPRFWMPDWDGASFERWLQRWY